MEEFAQDALALGRSKNVMRELFEFGKLRKAEVGEENVYDFSLGNPSVPPPEAVNETIIDILTSKQKDAIHCYTSAQGDLENRRLLAQSLNRRFNAECDENDIYFTVGAAAALTVTFHALTTPGDEIIVFAPFFGEYKVFIEGAGAKTVICPPNLENFEPDINAFASLIGEHTKAVVINSPNNPSGVVYSAEALAEIAAVLKEKSAKYGRTIYLITDEPYREIVFDGAHAPWVPDFYDNTVVCYSYSKSLSLPGERIGYIFLNKKLNKHDELYAAICGAGRKLGFVNAPSLFQKVAAICDGKTADMSVYEKNRDMLYNALCSMGYECIKPQGTFYLFMKAPMDDAVRFCNLAKDFDLLLVPTDTFACPGYVRIAFCVDSDTITRSLGAFEKLMKAVKK